MPPLKNSKLKNNLQMMFRSVFKSSSHTAWLQGLPSEIVLYHILMFLDLKTVLNFFCTNKEYYWNFIESHSERSNDWIGNINNVSNMSFPMIDHDEKNSTVFDANSWWYHYCKGLIPSRIYKHSKRDELELNYFSYARDHRKQVTQLFMNYLEILHQDNGKLGLDQPNFSPYRWISFLRDYFYFKYSQKHYKHVLDLDVFELNDEEHVSKVLLTNDFHSFYNAHSILKGCWETVCCEHRLLCLPNSATIKSTLQTANQVPKITSYHWMVHLTQYTVSPDNSWNLLIGVDNLFNPSRTPSSTDVHYAIGSTLDSEDQIYVKPKKTSKQEPHAVSKGIGYCVQSDAPLVNGDTSYTFKNTNTEGDVLGISFYFTPPETITFKVFGRSNNEKSRDQVVELCVVSAEISTLHSPKFYPSVSLTAGQCVTLLPWNGDSNVLLRHIQSVETAMNDKMDLTSTSDINEDQ
ncbi:hypothetical protein C9374_002198 [Naegleria lovaniensis]|uniref:F-box domain-containing protein n=1 Tax=Naegleria lovaniensis TaxID=51637 RepID=A0AA88KM16_NAELO|nr:uncharacterized protein C9374_002198 [Naegleria lovaniensis]KAG2386454.1 hypothetical protein C9374_002198 [Naegleria lovaniensis]